MLKKIVLSVAVAGAVVAATSSAFAGESRAAQIAHGSVSQNEAVAIGILPKSGSN